ncbi:MAG: hypothetical protein RL189_2338 [Pseudomonadota bacterium]
MAGQHHCSFVARMNWRRSGASVHPSVHVLSLQQNCTSTASNQTIAWIVGTGGVHAGEDFRLTQGESIIGSGWDADIVLTSPEVSRTHAKISSTNHLCVLEDLGSGSGTFVNGERCDDPRALNHRDVIKIGMGEFIYFALDPESVQIQPAVSPKAVSSPSGKTPSQRAAVVGWLVCQSGELSGLDFRLTEGVNRVGSLSGLEVTIPDPNLNSVHMNLECSADRIYMRPVSSGLQLMRNNQLIDAGVLKDGDLIRCGSLILRFRSHS